MASIDLVEIEMASVDEAAQAFPDLPEIEIGDDDGDTGQDSVCGVPAPGMEFETQLELKNFIEGFAKRTGCRVIIKFKTFAKASRSVELFGHEGAWARGDGYCNFKTESEKADRSVKSSCSLNIPFTYDVGRRQYVIKGDRFCLSHNHLLSYIINLGKYSLPFPMVMLVLTMAEALARSLPVTFKSSCMDVMRLRWMYWFLHADFYLDNK
ncbi:unnamed protein product (mitochondrion) [Plasmodiophora brassicae]|uniref:Uncharacterized protein n=1 Tax=Plasmodiophora brassicae TaxID=37360 RepID=A0A3P3YD68_PLABS|nr:unnamed protein product [Plasmodiophora brassicae]